MQLSQGTALELEQSWKTRVLCLERGEMQSCFLTNPNFIDRFGKQLGWFVSLGDRSDKVHSNSHLLWFNKQWSPSEVTVHPEKALGPCSWTQWEFAFLCDFGKGALFLSVLPFHLFFTSHFSENHQTWLPWKGWPRSAWCKLGYKWNLRGRKRGSSSLFLISGWKACGATCSLTIGQHVAGSFVTLTCVCDQTVFKEGSFAMVCVYVCVLRVKSVEGRQRWFQMIIRNEGYIHFVGAGRKAQVLGLSWRKTHCQKERSKRLWIHEPWTKGMGQVAVCLPSEGSLWTVSACSGQAFIMASARRLPGVLVPPHRAVVYE